MQSADLIKFIREPQLLKKENVKDLQELVRDFPYFQPAHLLLSLASKQWDASVYQQSLKKTAIVVSNRGHLFRLIHDLENKSVLQTKDVDLDVTPEPPSEKTRATTQEHAAHELDILKAAEVSVAQANANNEAVKPVEEKISIEQLHPEIEKHAVTARVETEILNIAEKAVNKEPAEKPESFGDWLYFLKKNNGEPYHEIEEKVKQEKAGKQVQEEVTVDLQKRKQKNKALIDKIIDSNPGHIRVKEEQKFYTPDTKAKESLLENEHLVTETLARIYALQGSVNKAVRAYEILSLKYPQKSAYFASLIQKLKNNQ